ncbi:hypothetical protein ANCCAN_14563 [Ancylostoma caninum]|uniref:Uncharacterized protein n=1 Tax=Ancylostoma caninum TaxID=29170 RepID=A0A368G915_ANCCA|nr:hypothetical protein ANCCAN_14563 [Ancylostoma caninum]
MKFQTSDLKRRRVSRGTDESALCSSTPQLITSPSVQTLTVERPTRAASSSPHSFTNYRESRDEEFNIERGRPLRATVGHGCCPGNRPTLSHGFASTGRVSSRTREPRFPSPSDFLSHSFLKQAVIFDRNVQLKKFLEGGLWTRLRNSSNTPPRTSSPQSEPVATSKPVPDRKSKSAKRKRDNFLSCKTIERIALLNALTDVMDDDFLAFPCRSCSEFGINFCCNLQLAISA